MSFDWLSVLGGGAEWIWNAADDQLPGYRGPRVIFHAAEHLAAAGVALYGDSTAEA